MEDLTHALPHGSLLAPQLIQPHLEVTDGPPQPVTTSSLDLLLLPHLKKNAERKLCKCPDCVEFLSSHVCPSFHSSDASWRDNYKSEDERKA